MDIKTLEYMEKRAAKGRDLINRIHVLSESIDLINESDSFGDLSVRTNQGDRDLIRRYEGSEDCAENKSNVELYRILRATILNAFIDKRKKLQEELEEI